MPDQRMTENLYAPGRETQRGVRLLAADPDLGSGLSRQEFEQAREELVLPCMDLEVGPSALERIRCVPGLRDPLHGFLVLAGILAVNLRMSGRTCTRLIGSPEMVLLDGIESDTIPISWDWSVLASARVAVVDARLHTIARRWPALLTAILERAAQQTRHAFVQQAISQLPRVEERLLALFWAIADRQGVVRADGVWVELSVTHEMLAHMVGAQRPTVSLGLARLAEGGVLRSEPNGWLLAHDSLDVFADSAEPEADSGEDPSGFSATDAEGHA